MRRAVLSLVVLSTLVLGTCQAGKKPKPNNVDNPESSSVTKFDADTLNCRDYWDFEDGAVVAIESRNYPNNYPNRRKCFWAFSVPPNTNVSIVCEKFQVHRSDRLCLVDSVNNDCWYGDVDYPFQFPFTFPVTDDYSYLSIKFLVNRRRNAGGFRFNINRLKS